ncbi:DUF523 domain-containing protein [Blastomonas sp. UPD001]|uniref:DUF523 domain-containing protein n=1 Tax=Blastomonas sp. UPD001 TaxID=2217673 RepID=UPI0018E51AC3|nr:DUF523 domain-containing protein [Blastomonas sp. UPD001]
MGFGIRSRLKGEALPPAKLLVSACLLGKPVRYDGRAKTLDEDRLAQWIEDGRVVPVCPELLAGLPTPRLPAEIKGGTGREALDGAAVIVEADGADVTSTYVDGARATLALAVADGCRFALLTDGSPSCGGSFIYDGSFTSARIPGEGVVAALLRQHEIQVFTPSQLSLLEVALAVADAAQGADEPGRST